MFEEVNEAVGNFIAGTGNLTHFNCQVRLQTAWSNSQFLFGPEVSEQIERFQSLASQMSRIGRRLEASSVSAAERDALIDEQVELDKRLSQWKEPWTKVCIPYMRMAQRRVRTPVEWFHDRNELRKSFGN
ncbi:hypothetical protein ACHMW7_03830 [Aminobacter sp. UC22_36]|uniref:hypothetical protein n=1 Tax=Aminobacter sp. UC22_36 TaxID=3374549 RepID=UPI00375814B1